MASAAVVERPAQTVDKARAPRPRALTSDVVIVGCGVAGLYSALNLPRALRVTMICKEDLESCDSMLAQGGICVMRDRDDYDSWFDDTMRAGHGECRAQSVDTMIWSSRDVIADLVHLGVEFDRTPDGGYDYTREGAHSRPRILHHADVTGKEITTKLLAQVRLLPNVEIREHVCMDDLLVEGGSCVGVVAHDAHDRRLELRARDVILATGGVGGLYERSTNFPCLTGDGCRVAAAHGVTLDHMDYVQIHPTSLYTEKPGRAFLISESCRGEGAILLNAAGERFCDELVICGHFAHIWQRCLEEGYDIRREPIPVVPAQHYLMGGIHVGANSETSLPHLYAAGETSCNGVHGANRLASNSLLESLVFSRLAARNIVRERHAA